ncbi:hypothetical protein VTJ49DRAFT_5881 [Mycothermus thermophilus]|uniref:Uncharacterized protein n=1 Tax=Humicola insolens TaxID=85995 RepID=A0ABR3VK60_HUMIN
MFALRSVAAPVQRQCFRAAPRAATSFALQNQRLYSTQQDRVAKFDGKKDAQVSKLFRLLACLPACDHKLKPPPHLRSWHENHSKNNTATISHWGKWACASKLTFCL